MKKANRNTALVIIVLVVLGFGVLTPQLLWANPWNGKVVLQAFWWDAWNDKYPQDWYTYLAKLAPRLRELGFDGMWIPSPAKGDAGGNSMGYDIFDHYDLGDKDQKGTVATRFGSKDSLLRLVAVAHANGLEVYPDIVLNHVSGGEADPQAPGDQFKKFRYVAFSGPNNGRWAKDHWNFHPNPDHQCTDGDICQQSFGPDVCYLDADHGGGGNGQYMRDRAREWFVWLTKQLGADGFRFDAVKHFESYMVEDLLYHAMGDRLDYFAVGELVGSQPQLDTWANQVHNRSGTFDFPLREALANIVDAAGFFDMSRLPSSQQQNRLKTVPFVNNHDTWRGAYWDSNPGSLAHDDRSGDWRQNGDELAPTIDPDNPRTDVAYAAAFAVDGSPMVFYEDLFVNHGPERFKADPQTIQTRDYMVNLIWAHQKLNFKDGAYKVRYQASPDLLVVERSGKALIGLNDHGIDWRQAWVQTDFGPRVKLHDYSGANAHDLETNADGWVQVAVPPMGYAIWGPVGIGGGFAPQSRRTTQEFQLDDDLGDARGPSLQYGGKLDPGAWRTGGAIWTADHSVVKVWVYTDEAREVELRVYKPNTQGQKSKDQGQYSIAGETSNEHPLYLEFQTEAEGYHQLAARITNANQLSTRAYLKVEYAAPPPTNKF
jgi:alpha-amylase